VGEVIQASCECGFKTPEILVSDGFMINNNRRVPALCPKCKELVIVDYLKKGAVCPTCHGKITFYNHPSLRTETSSQNDNIIVIEFNEGLSEGNSFRLPDANYLCPKCGQMKLRFSSIGNWD
jgi:Zn finger protein HypA/HybF involved in hydrogenase expression